MTPSPLNALETLCRDGASFEQALTQIGFADAPLSVTATIFKYWKLLEMEHAFAAARKFYDQYLQMQDA